MPDDEQNKSQKRMTGDATIMLWHPRASMRRARYDMTASPLGPAVRSAESAFRPTWLPIDGSVRKRSPRNVMKPPHCGQI
jgi:hypothetical protein